MAELKFKHGSYLDLMNADGTPNTGKTKLSEGTIYVTTDERAMFVDLKKPNENTVSRIRLEGAVQYYDTLEEFTATTKPPYSQTSLYFFRRLKNAQGTYDIVNAFMAWNGTEWKQVNVSKADFLALAERVSNAEGAINTLSDNANTLKGRVDDILTINGNTRTGYIKDIEDRLDDIHGVNGTGGEIKNIKDRLDAIHGANGDSGEIAAIKEAIDDLNNTTTGRVPALEAAVGTHETRLDDLLDTNNGQESGRIVTIEGNISSHETRLDDLLDKDAQNKETGRIVDIEKDINDLQKLVGTGDGTGSDLSGRLTVAEQDIGKLQNAVTNTITPTLTSHTNRLDALYKDENGTKTGKIVNIESRLDAIHGANGSGGEISTIKGRLDAIHGTNGSGGEISIIKGRLDAIHGANGSGGEIKELKDAVATINNTTIPTLAVKTEVAEDIANLKEELQAEIDSDINAANAMTFKGVVAKKENLPTTNVRIGDTYVLSQTDSHVGNDTTIDYSAGDFFIASGTESTTTGFITGTITWNHVKSGYDAAFDPSFQTTITNAVKDETTDTSGSAVISLGNFAGASLGQVTLAPSGNIKIKGDAGNIATARTINISFEWGTF